jgi:cystathionine beta-lyase/cystathionine gamma-synthase
MVLEVETMKKRVWNQLTSCVHAGGYQDQAVGAVATPIFHSSSYRYSEDRVVCYPRYYNLPTQQAAAEKLAALEGGEDALVVGSGMAAIGGAFQALLKAGDHAVIQNNVYGGTYHFVTSRFERMGIDYTMVSGDRVEDFAAVVKPETRVIYFETPTNPLLAIVDIRAMVSLAKKSGALTIIDNTFASPINQNPLEYGIDVVTHSGTKYLGGHSDLCCGAMVGGRAVMMDIASVAVDLGAVLGAFECSLLERSLKTLGLRVKQQNRNGLELARFLADHPRVKQVHYPGLPSHPGHETAKEQMRGFGGMLSVELDGDPGMARRIVENLELFTHAVSLGGVESLVCFPCLTSHAKMPEKERRKLGISDTLLRISVGIEDSDDLIADFKQALES